MNPARQADNEGLVRVGLLLKRGKPEALEIARELCTFLGARNVEAWVVGNHNDPALGARAVGEDELSERIDLLVVLGGDGTLLHGAELVADRGIPILGVNLGHLGFLTSCPPAEALATLAAALDGKLVQEERMRLRVELIRESGAVTVAWACNDVVVSQSVARLMDLEARLDGKLVSTYRADGLIVSTPTGSTAYNLAAGGPILTPDLQVMVLTPICPHTLAHRPLVVAATSRMTIRLAAPARDVLLTVDGQAIDGLGDHDLVEVHAASRPLKLYLPWHTSYFDILREKLQWGGRLGPSDSRGR